LTAIGLITFLFCFSGFIMSLTAHEWAHAWMANRCGDPTARLMGRMTFNPIRHIDPVMTIIFPIIAMFAGLPLIGGAKPVPVNPLNYTNYRKSERLVSLAGVAVNLVIALVLSLIIRLVYSQNPDIAKESPFFAILSMTMLTNLFLMVFNLFPIPPLDGSGFLATFMPPEMAANYRSIGRYGIFIIVILLYMGVVGPLLWATVEFMIFHVLRFDTGVSNAVGESISLYFENLGLK